MDYFEVRISCQKSESDLIEEALMELGACSVTYRDAEDIAILEPAPGHMPLWQQLEITGMFTVDIAKMPLVAELQSRFPDHPIQSKDLQNQIWERVWLKHFKPMKFGSKTWVIPSEYDPIDSEAVNIFLDPGLAFGTGTHATTALCLQWVDENPVKGKTLIDFGCGSGILAIAALKHNAAKVYCTDIDPQAIESTESNSESNGVAEGIYVINPSDFDQLEKLDVVLANILAGPLMSLVETFYKLLKPRGTIIMSGILAEQGDELVEKFQSHFIDFQVKRLDDWISVEATRKD